MIKKLLHSCDQIIRQVYTRKVGKMDKDKKWKVKHDRKSQSRKPESWHNPRTVLVY